jgi:toxin CptA
MDDVAGALLALALLGLGAVAAWSRALLRSPEAVRAIEIDGEGVSFELASRARFAVSIAERRYVTRWLVTLPVTRPTRRTLLLTPDMLDSESFRRLRVWALWGKVPVARPPLAATETALH